MPPTLMNLKLEFETVLICMLCIVPIALSSNFQFPCANAFCVQGQCSGSGFQAPVLRHSYRQLAGIRAYASAQRPPNFWLSGIPF